MKGFTHFAAGLAAASCFPGAVAAAAAGNPLYFILGGAAGILPDTLDFKFYRFFVCHDMEVVPDPNEADPRMIAEAMAYAVNRAFESGKPVCIKLNTIAVGTDRWQQYTVKFDVAGRRVTVRYGPIVDTGQNPVDGIRAHYPEASAPLICPIVLDYEATVNVDIFDGPLFTMRPTSDNRMVRPEFIPWHREWSHGLLATAVLAAGGAALFGWLAGFVMAAAYGAHILVDQLGFMGSNLLFPLRRCRTNGLGLVHSASGIANAVTVWFSCLVIFWHLSRHATGQILQFNMVQLFLFGGLLPILLFLLIDRILGRRSRAGGPGDDGEDAGDA